MQAIGTERFAAAAFGIRFRRRHDGSREHGHGGKRTFRNGFNPGRPESGEVFSHAERGPPKQ